MYNLVDPGRHVSINISTTLSATMSLGLVWFYILTVGFLDETVVAVKVSETHIMMASLGAASSLVWFPSGAKTRAFAKTSL